MEKKTFKGLVDAIKNPPPDRLAKIEYQSNVLQAIGIMFVCISLIIKGFWYVIFALIFGVGISYSQGMTAYMKYKAIKSIYKKDTIKDIEEDISPSRKRSKIIKLAFGNYAKYISIIISVVLPIFFIDIHMNRIYFSVLYFVSIFVIFTFIYYFIFYWLSKPIYLKKIKES